MGMVAINQMLNCTLESYGGAGTKGTRAQRDDSTLRAKASHYGCKLLKY